MAGEITTREIDFAYVLPDTFYHLEVLILNNDVSVMFYPLIDLSTDDKNTTNDILHFIFKEGEEIIDLANDFPVNITGTTNWGFIEDKTVGLRSEVVINDTVNGLPLTTNNGMGTVGTNDQIGPLDMTKKDFSIQAIFDLPDLHTGYFQGLTYTYGLVSKHADSNGLDFYINITSDGIDNGYNDSVTVVFRLNDTTSFSKSIDPTSISPGLHHLAVIRDYTFNGTDWESIISLYLDRVKITEWTTTADIYNNNEPLRIGKTANTTIQSIRISNGIINPKDFDLPNSIYLNERFNSIIKSSLEFSNQNGTLLIDSIEAISVILDNNTNDKALDNFIQSETWGLDIDFIPTITETSQNPSWNLNIGNIPITQDISSIGPDKLGLLIYLDFQ